MLRSRIDKCSRLLMYHRYPIDPEWPASIGGSGMLTEINGGLCILTTRHCMESTVINDPQKGKLIVGCFWEVGQQGLVYFDRMKYIRDTDPKSGFSDGRHDLAILYQDSFKSASRDAVTLVDGQSVLYDPATSAGSELVAIGFPEGIGCPINGKVVKYKCAYVHVIHDEYVHSGLIGVGHVKNIVDSEGNIYDLDTFNFNGLSGSPIWHFPKTINKALFTGTVTSCSGGKIRYVSSKLAVDFARKTLTNS